jgi:hypothetical protein
MKDNINMVITVVMRNNGKNGRKKTKGKMEEKKTKGWNISDRDSCIHFKICKIIFKFYFLPQMVDAIYLMLSTCYYARVIGILKFNFYFY